MALAGEAGELVTEFQWLAPEASEPDQLSSRQRVAIEDEIADVLFYLLRLATRLDIDLDKACVTKLAKNEQRYPIEDFRGSAEKAPSSTSTT